MRILIAEDDPINRKLLTAQIEADRHFAFAVSNGVEALALLREEKMDAIISDIRMPHMDGFRLCEEVRKDPTLCQVRFIFYSNTYTSLADERFALSLGADGFLKKPARTEMILDALRSVTLIAPAVMGTSSHGHSFRSLRL